MAIVAPALHTVSDALEWAGGGFTTAQLLLNYVAFVPMPFLLLGLHSIQSRRAGHLGLTGALLYGIAFVYFMHSTLVALERTVPDYETLWARLGSAYTVHGALMVVGGLAFGLAALKARTLSRTGLVLFMVGLGLNLTVGVTPLPDIIQTIGSAVRNVGLIAIGIELLRNSGGSAEMQPN